ncbi:hypothetical protein [Parafilimonas sp.]|uniref:hypothetical protein n=1 Tax=Parafilimonas sp. TaxID=1969739 RepID=UPI0039E242D6
MKYFVRIISIIGLLIINAVCFSQQALLKQNNLAFEWDVQHDKAALKSTLKESTIWQGSLMPAFWLKRNDSVFYVKAFASGNINDSLAEITIGNIGKGFIKYSIKNSVLRIDEIKINWLHETPAIIEMYIGTSPVKDNGNNVPLPWDRPFAPDWSAAAYCIPGAKEGTVQSYFRMWDLGQATINLGNFGPGLSTLYGAAFPHPTLFAAMGSQEGWICFGAGTVPDAALNMKVLATKGCFQYLYREDIWGASSSLSRIWQNPLRITIDTTAYEAFAKYYASFPAKEKNYAPFSFLNTWGMWRQKKYTLEPIVNFAKKVNAGAIVMDDGWESEQGSGKVNAQRFPGFENLLQSMRDQKINAGFWETIGWISDTVKYGFTSEDLILDKNGKPLKTNWNFDPSSPSYYCLDISSSKVKKFLQDRTTRQMQELKPVLLKLDFGYALPNPDMGVPRNPEYRGERYTYALFKTIAEAARKVNPDVMIMNYGISPLWLPYTDMVSLDDQGDLWYETAKGHAEWSIWASLLSQSGVMVSGSSSYNWDDDKEVLLNTAILGVPGATLPVDNAADDNINRRLALNTWYRKTFTWKPCWLNSTTGNYNYPPALNCWGRLENGQLTALALRPSKTADRLTETDDKISFSGRWALISQDEKSIYTTNTLAIIPFDAGYISITSAQPKSVSRLNIQGEANYTNWQWKDGKLSISISEKESANTAGFLIKR